MMCDECGCDYHDKDYYGEGVGGCAYSSEGHCIKTSRVCDRIDNPDHYKPQESD